VQSLEHKRTAPAFLLQKAGAVLFKVQKMLENIQRESKLITLLGFSSL
jgi:hypothetical protein